MTPNEAHKRLLAYAVDRLGAQQLAERLKTDEVSIEAWLSGTEQPPTRAVLALADLVYEMQKSAP